jgi:hypothetical protein
LVRKARLSESDLEKELRSQASGRSLCPPVKNRKKGREMRKGGVDVWTSRALGEAAQPSERLARRLCQLERE